ncbi:MAG: peptidoglycan DD-metalloendopeptidase family protein [Anaerolineales bacterium]|uniref:Peptidoglycan DD-metalloendopeptidase family protein n=1 Tax=Candidatus Desulfolinea nitratireducens TaxID=2841698 RepID=A0A8J6TK22_9CHLR|nr:peptidoglycan DD-metalloendopeptidase family protein [Candidatus Desulfolinea nitratireducens]MBL6959593.1 peptidoglycan DD-metalloendopeptidase family protein [Anaerolineales bacterium]
MSFLKNNLFSILSWVLTFVLVAVIIFIAYNNKDAFVETAPPIVSEATIAPETNPSIAALPGSAPTLGVNTNAIRRQITLKTLIPEDRPNYEVTHYTVARGDSTFSIATENNIEPETILWANYETLEDSPDSLRVGQELNIPPVDGIYHQLKEADTIESIAAEFEADPNDILHWPGNNVDLTNPTLNAGDWVMIPGGSREFIQWVIPIEASGDSGTSNISNSSCPGGAVGTGYFIWPADNHYLTGNDFWSGHLAIDIAANTGAAVYASDSGVVTMAQGGYNYGYGNVVAIDHGNGFATLYAHLSSINAGRCQSVFAGQLIGLSGNTGNSFGAHLHFEVRNNGAFQNPWRWLPAP